MSRVNETDIERGNINLVCTLLSLFTYYHFFVVSPYDKVIKNVE